MTVISNLNQFQPGTKVLSSEVNDNFERLRQSHNDIDARVSSIETQPEKLPLGGGTLTGAVHSPKPVCITCSTSTLTLTEAANSFVVDGTEPITSIKGWTSGVALIRWNSVRTIAYDSLALILSNGCNRVTSVGDVGIYEFNGSEVREISYFPNKRRKVSVPVRQTVLSAKTNDGTADPSFLLQGSGLGVNILGGAIPVVVAFAAGFDSEGAVDYVGTVAKDINNTWSNLMPSTTNYLYIERNFVTGELSYGYTNTAPVYGVTAPVSPTVGTHFFNISTMVMSVFNGSAWDQKHRVFVGEALTSASSVSNIVTYALQGKYESDFFSTGSSALVTKNHNIGTINTESRILIQLTTAIAGYASGAILEDVSIGSNSRYPFIKEVDKNTMSVYIAGLELYNRTSVATVTVLAVTQFNTKYIVKRGF